MFRFLAFLAWFGGMSLYAQELPLSRLQAGAGDPVYTVYAAPPARSSYMIDEGYRLVLHEPSEPLRWTTDSAGSLAVLWSEGEQSVAGVGEYFRRPVLQSSFADGGRLSYSPLQGIDVTHDFSVSSSRFLIQELDIRNASENRRRIGLSVLFQMEPGILEVDVPRSRDHFAFRHEEPPGNWSETKLRGFPRRFLDVLVARPEFSSQNLLFGEPAHGRSSARLRGSLPNGLLGSLELEIPAGRERTVRLLRGVDAPSRVNLWMEAQKLIHEVSVKDLLEDSARAYSAIPRLSFRDSRLERLYWQAFTLIRQMMMPPEGAASYNYYLFSREPTWGWGHDGQVFHESLAMLAYVYMDALSAMDSQRVYMERQQPDGYIHYRVGPYVARDFRVRGRNTSSAPFFNWINLELFRVSADREFLGEAYESGSRYIRYLRSTRDRDGDGLFEWGGNGLLESVRDGHNVIWDLLGNQPDSPSKVEALDLNCMMVREMKSLAEMARELGRDSEAAEWRSLAGAVAEKINRLMWDEESRFYYHIDQKSHSFRTSKGIDLRRMEIIGFLPLWAGIVPSERLSDLRRHLTDSRKFWRRNGVPTLAADDPFFDPRVDHCCKWNGPVWMPWNYLVFRGLLENGLRAEAEELAVRSFDAVLEQLAANHLFWESYSPDSADEPRTYAPYIWTGIVARMMIDLDSGS